MYFNNLVKLASFYLKHHIPDDKQVLQEYITCSDDKNTPKQANEWLLLMQNSQEQSSQNLQQQINLLSPFLSTNLSIDAWYSGAKYELINNHNYIEFIFTLLHNKNINISTQSLTEEQYHLFQSELFNFAKALLYFLLKKNYSSDYQEQQFKNWLAIN